MSFLNDKELIKKYIRAVEEQSKLEASTNYITVEGEKYSKSLLTKISVFMYRDRYYCAILLFWVIRGLRFLSYKRFYEENPFFVLIEIPILILVGVLIKQLGFVLFKVSVKKVI